MSISKPFQQPNADMEVERDNNFISNWGGWGAQNNFPRGGRGKKWGGLFFLRGAHSEMGYILPTHASEVQPQKKSNKKPDFRQK